jgi:XTP/dITP diphosphohydrolase
MRSAPRIVVASLNAGKCREIARILEDFEVISLSGLEPVAFPEEGGDYVENARAKALAAARATGLPCVADDSGLEVECLGGAPGPYSARYGGPGLDDRGRVDHLLKSIAGEPSPRRARFFCVAAVALPDGRSEIAEGACTGEILNAPRGEGGFGYDPIFRPDGHTRALAELDREEKDALSHRGRAFRALEPKLVRLLGSAGD